MDKEFVLAFDASTTSAQAIIFDRKGEVVAMCSEEIKQHYPQPGWVEHDPKEIWDKQVKVTRDVLEKASLTAQDIAAIGITNQRETTVIWDKSTGNPIHNAIVWQDRRTAGACDAMRKKGLGPYVAANTGLLIDSYFSGTKVEWILDNVDGARSRAENGELAFGTVDSWLIWNLTGGEAHVTDVTNASRTMLFNIKDVDWDAKLLSEMRVPRALLPQVKDSSAVYGYTTADLFGAPIPVAAAAGDQHAALFGHACFERGMAKCSYGTAAALMMNTGDTFMEPDEGLVSTIAISIDGKVQYAIEGVLFTCGAAVQWLRDEMRIIEKSSDAVCTVPDNNGVYFVPAFTGTSAPTWDSYARGMIIGLTRGANREHLIRATLESIAYQVNDVVTSMNSVSGFPLESLKVDGGTTANDFVMQFQADISNIPVMRPTVTDSAARGAAFLAGLATGVWKDRAELTNTFELERQFAPEMARDTAEALYGEWLRATQRSLDWIQH